MSEKEKEYWKLKISEIKRWGDGLASKNIKEKAGRKLEFIITDK